MVEDLDNVLARLELEPAHVLHKYVQQVGVVGLLGELRNEFGERVCKAEGNVDERRRMAAMERGSVAMDELEREGCKKWL